MPTAADTRALIEQQIMKAWALYVDACLTHDKDCAGLAMRQIDRLLERMPRPREASD
jgi:hypothetical protein